ncbi:MAG: 50S ribosomal protein L35 [Isosphaeraceae bacterium]
MPSIKMKTHKGTKKRFKVTASGKVLHKRCGSSHLNSHKSGKQIRRLRKKSVIKIDAVAQRLRRAMQQREVVKARDLEPFTSEETPTIEPTQAAPSA